MCVDKIKYPHTGTRQIVSEFGNACWNIDKVSFKNTISVQLNVVASTMYAI